MTVIVRSGGANTVVVNRDRAVNTVVRRATPVTTREERAVSTVIDRSDTTNVSSPGVQGPRGAPGDGVYSSDDIVEGDTNLYYTDERAEAVAQAAASASIALHTLAPDPHPQYIDASDVIDGGNF